MTTAPLSNLVAAFPSARPPFLLLSPICVVLALALVSTQQAINMASAILAIIGAITAAMAVNTINEYQDYKSGLDLTTQRTPFSGGSGLLVKHEALLPQVKRLAILSVSITFMIGVYFASQVNGQIIAIGLAGLAIIISYTKWLNKQAILCYLAPGVGFGYLMTFGTLASQELAITVEYALIMLMPCILISNLLLVNQFPDIEQDKQVGRNHWAIRYGANSAATLYLISSVAAIITLISLVISNTLPVLSLVALLPLMATLIVYSNLKKFKQHIGNHPKYMALNVALTLLTPLLIACSLLFT